MKRFRSFKQRAVFNPAVYEVIAGIVRTMPDDVARKAVADHFATEFNRRSKSFDPSMWERATGGKPAPNSAA